MARINVTGGDPESPDQQAKRIARQAAQQYQVVMADLTTNWDSLTNAAKLAAVRTGVILALRVLRYMWLRTGADME